MVTAASAPVVRPVRKESLAAALHRLAAKGRAEGLVILDDVGAAPFACRVTSSRAGHGPYIVNLTSGPLHGCDCPGFAKFGRCKHYALCLEAAGWLPDPDDPPPAAPLAALPRAERREVAAADLASRFPSRHPARIEDLEAA